MSTPYQQLIANQEAQKQTVLKNQQQRQEQAKKNELVNTISQGLVADQMLTSGEGRKQLGSFIADQLGIGSTSTVAGDFGGLSAGTPVASSQSGTMLASANPALSGQTVPMSMQPPPVESGTPFFDVGAPSTAGYVAGAVRGARGVQRFFDPNVYEKDRNRQAIWDAGMTVANVYTGGLAELGDTAAQKLLGKGGYKEAQKVLAYTTPTYWMMNAVGSGKDRDQFNRDQVRKSFGELKFVDDQFNVSLADGTKFNIGVDGKAKPEYGIDPNTGKAMHAFDLNHSDPLVKQLVPMVNPLVNVLTGGDKKLASDFTGYLVRAAMSNSGGDFKKAMSNVQSFYQQLNANPTDLASSIDKMLADKKIDAQTAAIWKNDINKATSGMNWGNTGTGSNIGGFKIKSTPPPKPAPQPYQPTKSVSQSYAARSQQTQAPQGQNVGALYSNFAKNFVPQSSVNRREQQ